MSSDPNAVYRLSERQSRKERYRIFSRRKCTVKDRKKIELSGNVTVTEPDPSGQKRVLTLQAERAWLHIEGAELSPTLTLELLNATWQKLDGSKGLTRRYLVRDLVLPKSVTDAFIADNVLEVLNPAYVSSTLKKGPDANFLALQNELRRKIQRTLIEIKAEMHSRLVFGLGLYPDDFNRHRAGNY